MKYLRLAVQEPVSRRNPMHTLVVDHDDLHLAQLWNWNETADLDLMLFRVVGAMDPYEAALEEVPFVADYRTARIDDDSFYVYVEHETRAEDPAFREPFLEQRVLTMPPIEFAADGETRMELVGRAADVQAVVDGFPTEFEVRVDEIGTYEQGVTAFASLLTDRQQEAVSAAVELGYYDVPKTAAVEDVAGELDCATSTASNHLRKAEARLARRVLAE